MKTHYLVALIASLSLTACGVGYVDNTGDASADGADLTANGKFEIFTGADGKFYFHLLAGNGEKVLASQSYASASSAKSGVDSVKTNGTNSARYEQRLAADGSPYFVLKAANGKVIAVSQLYSSVDASKAAVTSTIAVVTAAASQAVAPVTGQRFEVFKGLDGKYYFDLRAQNGEIVLQSQGYSAKSSAESGVSSVMTNGADASHYELRNAADGETYFVLKAGNSKVIGLSEMYASTSNAQRGEDAVVAILSTTHQ